MGNILVILKSYSTHSRPNALCVEGISKYLEEDGINIDYMSIEMGVLEQDDEKIIPVYIKRDSSIKTILEQKICKFIFSPISDIKLVKNIYSSLLKQIKVKEYDMIVAVCNPPETAEALYRLKRKLPNINTVMYEIDSNSNRYKNTRNFIEFMMNYRSYQWEMKIYSSMDKVIHMESHKRHYAHKKFTCVKDKFEYLDIPYLDISKGKKMMEEKNTNNYYRFIYAGAFYPKLRDPDYTIQVIKKLSEVLDIRFDVYTGNKMRKELKSKTDHVECINLYDEISQEEVLMEMEKSDVLVSVGNKNSDFLPSKVMLYMSTGKKILHFYPVGDVAVSYLKKYPNICLISQEDELDDVLIQKVIDFLKQDKKIVDLNFLYDNYKKNTPYYSAKEFKRLLMCFMGRQ